MATETRAFYTSELVRRPAREGVALPRAFGSLRLLRGAVQHDQVDRNDKIVVEDEPGVNPALPGELFFTTISRMWPTAAPR